MPATTRKSSAFRLPKNDLFAEISRGIRLRSCRSSACSQVQTRSESDPTILLQQAMFLHPARQCAAWNAEGAGCFGFVAASVRECPDKFLALDAKPLLFGRPPSSPRRHCFQVTWLAR